MRTTAVDGRAIGRLFCVAQTVCIYYERVDVFVNHVSKHLRHSGMRATGGDGRAIGSVY
jgi:hypothetical protein